MNFSDIPEDQKPKIEFPCQYPIKVMGDTAHDFEAFVVEVLQRHAEVDIKATKIKQSAKGNFQSITVIITATGKPQLEAIYAELKISGRVKMVL